RSGARTVKSDRHRTFGESRLSSLTRLYLVGCIAWPLFALPDVLPIVITGETRNIGWIIALRAFGQCLALPAYGAFRFAGRSLSQTAITTIDATVFLLGAVFLAMMALPFDAIASDFQLGVLIFILARCVLLPQHWRRAIGIPAACIAMYPATL